MRWTREKCFRGWIPIIYLINIKNYIKNYRKTILINRMLWKYCPSGQGKFHSCIQRSFIQSFCTHKTFRILFCISKKIIFNMDSGAELCVIVCSISISIHMSNPAGEYSCWNFSFKPCLSWQIYFFEVFKSGYSSRWQRW